MSGKSPSWPPPYQDEITGGGNIIISTTSTDQNSSPTSTLAFPRHPSATLNSNIIQTPCAACRILRRRCSADKCILAPYFPPTDPLKFAIAHKVFGASNIIKMLQELPDKEQREDAVSSMVYEANARLRDPVYGITGAISHLQNQVSQLQAELSEAEAELITLRNLHADRTTKPHSSTTNTINNHHLTPAAGQTADGDDHYYHRQEYSNHHLPSDHQSFDELSLDDQSLMSGFINFYTDRDSSIVMNTYNSPVWEPLWA